MAQYNFNEIKVVDDSIDDMDVIKAITDTVFQEKPFYIANIGKMIQKHDEWTIKMPRVDPHFAVKSNPDLTVIKVLAALDVCFDCASKQEIKLVMQYGVHGDRIIFAHPTKYPSHITYAKKVGVKQMTVDNEAELFKIKDLFPEAKVVIRIRCDSKNTLTVLGLKFGCESNEAVRLIHLTKDLGLNLHGFSFHVGSPCNEPEAYGRGIEMCKQLITVSKSIGCDNVQLIDIGGGFPGESEKNFDQVANIVNEAIQDLDPAIRVISEPGRYYVSSSFTLASNLHSKRIVSKDDKTTRMYYMNCGVFNSFMENLMGLHIRVPRLLSEPTNDEKFCSSLWGPSADSYDIIVKDVLLPELHIGDWLVWKDMGAYTTALTTTFNGFPVPTVIPIIKKSQWKNFKARINLERKASLVPWKSIELCDEMEQIEYFSQSS
ncbi:PREDICTED: ornithine decarboxylase 2-like [Dinoponera quadriceps]|uniref:Ornithine decarboxylase 2-like n=1 Tax=Dinoponera quadriceps TaxID=609295 RepID=A0A6P3XYS0_DINQU|nr:PREDICTED: ornithine decarboxylase 2-like [Dinoponera quadriceps]